MGLDSGGNTCYFRDQTPQKKKLDVAENVTEINSPSERMSNKIQNCLTDVNGEARVDNLEAQESVSERVEKLKGDLYFLEHVVSSLGLGNEGVLFVNEIASHLQTLRSLSMKRQRVDAASTCKQPSQKYCRGI